MSATKRTWSATFEAHDDEEVAPVNKSRAFDGFADDDDDEEPNFGRQILPVARLPADFDGVPVDGLQYLFTVRRDAKRLPNVTRAKLPEHLQQQSNDASDSTELSAESSNASNSSKGKQPAKAEPCLPSEEWRAVFLSRFKNFRKNARQQAISVDIPFSSNPQKKLMPDRKQRDAWWLFIAGRPSREWDPPRSEKARKRADRRANVSGRPYSGGVNGAASGGGDGLSGGVSLGAGTSQGAYAEPQRPVHFQSAYASDVTSWVVQETVQQEVLVYDEDGEVIEVSRALESMEEVKELLRKTQETVNGLEAGPSTTSGSNAGASTDLQEEEEKPGPPRQPTPNFLKPMDNTYCLHLLKYFTHWITLYVQQNSLDETKLPPNSATALYPHPSNPVLTQTHAQWIFALLTRVEEGISADDMSQLRMLARACMGLVKLVRERGKALGDAQDVADGVNSEVDDMSVSDDSQEREAPDRDSRKSVDPYAPFNEPACWIVVSAIADFWAQRDLWMDAEMTLSQR